MVSRSSGPAIGTTLTPGGATVVVIKGVRNSMTKDAVKDNDIGINSKISNVFITFGFCLFQVKDTIPRRIKDVLML